MNGEDEQRKQRTFEAMQRTAQIPEEMALIRTSRRQDMLKAGWKPEDVERAETTPPPPLPRL